MESNRRGIYEMKSKKNSSDYCVSEIYFSKFGASSWLIASIKEAIEWSEWESPQKEAAIKEHCD